MHSSTSKDIYPDNKNFNKFIYLFIFLGLALRLFHFFYDRSLWMDEVYLSTSLVKLNYNKLISGPLYYQQKAPILFLLATKFVVDLFGNKEIFLRIIPLISGMISMFLFIPVAKYFLKNFALLLAIAIICLSPALTYHSVEIKQYSTELLGTVLSLYLYIRLKDKFDLKNLIFWGFSGAFILWFSYSSIFILGGIGIGLTLLYLMRKNWNHLFFSLVPFSIWLISFSINYLIFTHKHAESEWIAYWFRAYDNFMPFPPKSISDLKWFAMNIYRMLDYPLGLLWNFNGFTANQNLNMILKMPFLPLIFLFTGIYIVFKRKLFELTVLIVPIVLMFLASGMELYPLTERFWVFIAPIFILFIAKGYEVISFYFKTKWMSILLVVLIMLGPAVQSAQSIFQPDGFYVHKKSFQREALTYLNENYHTGDAVYIYWNNLPGYRLYNEIYNFRYKAIEGKDRRRNSKDYEDYYKNLQNDFKKFSKHKRVWIVFNSQFLTDIGDRIDEPKWYYDKKTDPNQHLMRELFKNYSLIQKHETKDVTLYLLKQK